MGANSDARLPAPFPGIYDHHCTRCSLHEGAKTVCVEATGTGADGAMVVGEAPGRNEDEQGKPFVGQAGKLLDSVLNSAFMTEQARREVFVTNAVKCRPPGNRTPTDTETDACFSYLLREIEQVDPYVILALGNAAASVLLGETGITRLRGTWHRLDSERVRFVMPTFHPAYVLYQGGWGSAAHSLFVDDVTMFANKAIVGRT